MVGTKIMNRRIESRSTAGSSYAQTQRQRIQLETSVMEVNSALSVSSSNKI
jgi:hypothetical protein